MKTFILLTISLLMLGTCPRMVWAQDNPVDQKLVVHQHYLELMGLRSQVRQYKMEISDLQAKLGATILFGEDREEYNRLLEYDMEHLTSARTSLQVIAQYLFDHLSDLSQKEKGDVEESLLYPE